VQIDDVRPFSEEVLELATLIERDLIDSAHLDAYMEYLLNVHLIELSASCRIAARILPVSRFPSRQRKLAAGCGYGFRLSKRAPASSVRIATRFYMPSLKRINWNLVAAQM
jgi:hypothetical protein